MTDVNLFVYLYVEGAHTSEVREVLQRDPEWVVPPLWHYEFLNVLWQYIPQSTVFESASLQVLRSTAGLVDL